jgi:hypothetical protein
MTTLTMTTPAPTTPAPAATVPVEPVDALLAAARSGLQDARARACPHDRYRAAYAAALRAATAVLAARARPCPARRGPRGVWGLLTAHAPELAEWSDYFRLIAPVHPERSDAPSAAGTLTGATIGITERLADDLVRDAALFCRQVEQVLHR